MQSNSMMRVLRGLERKTLGRSALRGRLSSKQANKNYYKGKGAPSAGKFIDNKGHYQLVESKTPEIVVPDLSNCELKPYVSWETPVFKVPPPQVPQLTVEDLINSQVPLQRILDSKQYNKQQREAAAKAAVEAAKSEGKPREGRSPRKLKRDAKKAAAKATTQTA
eukprot:TRINITY_DN12770_c0_g1_i1.p1 TRINITY_DN12770_c0_g1~~TRINITY_DN12770_c0_g1_i1.p1  ORF type:complete len:165 (+),score=45.07 TRINITY_DN12770_c0_g1_i1:28-522(+)